MRPKRRPPRPKHPKFTHFHRSGLRFGRFPAQHRSIGGVGRPRRDRRTWPRCPWAVAGPGRASRRRTEPENSDQAPLVWRAPEGSAAVPVGGGGAWPDRETTRQARPQYTRHHWCGGRRRDLPRCRWAVAGPGRASRRRADQRPSPTGVEGAGGTGGPGCGAGGRWRGLARHRDDAPIGAPAPQVCRAPEGPEGTGGPRGAAPNEVRTPSLAGGRGLRRPKHPWRPTTTMTRPTRCAAHAGTGRGSG